MLAGILDHHKAELPHYKRIAKKKFTQIKNDWVEVYKADPAFAIMTGVAFTSTALAFYYRHHAKKISKGSWVELLQEWEDAMVDRGAVLGMIVDNGQLRAKIFEREETKY